METHLSTDALLRSVFDTVPYGILVFQTIRNQHTNEPTDLRLTMVNAHGAREMGSIPAVVTGKLYSELFCTIQDVERYQKTLAVVKTGMPFRYEIKQVSTRDGELHWYDVFVQKLDDGVVMTVMDMSGRKRAELNASRQTALLQNVVDQSPAGVVLTEPIYNASGHIVDFRYQLTNKLNAELTGYTIEQMVGQPISALFPGWQQLSLFESMVSVLQTGEPRQYTEEYNNYGVKGWFEYYFVKMEDAVLLMFLDVTRLKTAQVAQQQQADLLQNVVRNSPTGIVLYEAVRDAETGHIIDFIHALSNPTNDNVTGRPNGGVVGLQVLEYYPTNRTNGHFDILIEVVETGQPQRQLLDYRAHGINGWYDAQYVKQGDGVLFTYLDVTESQLYRSQLEMANRELKRSNDNLQQFAYVASHDLQEPLRKIQSFGNLLQIQAGAGLGETARDYITRMQQSAERMSLLIKDLLSYSRLSVQPDQHEPVSLAELISDIFDDLGIVIEQTQATVSAGDLPVVLGNQLQLYQLFQNLVSNALKFSSIDRTDASAPTVSITARKLSGPALLEPGIPLELSTGSVDQCFQEISIQDNGIGFDEKYLDRIFQVFQRLHGKSQFAGSGVGLAICKKVVENHGGAITATSQLGKGATFRVYLPG
ncbi:ATP-binding protein [Spirosoma montaniterrae]|nr:ATP-binding protein [Spirosoma montaniterrae]